MDSDANIALSSWRCGGNVNENCDIVTWARLWDSQAQLRAETGKHFSRVSYLGISAQHHRATELELELGVASQSPCPAEWIERVPAAEVRPYFAVFSFARSSNSKQLSHGQKRARERKRNGVDGGHFSRKCGETVDWRMPSRALVRAVVSVRNCELRRASFQFLENRMDLTHIGSRKGSRN